MFLVGGERFCLRSGHVLFLQKPPVAGMLVLGMRGRNLVEY